MATETNPYAQHFESDTSVPGSTTPGAPVATPAPSAVDAATWGNRPYGESNPYGQYFVNPAEAPDVTGGKPPVYSPWEIIKGGITSIPKSIEKFAKAMFHTGVDFVQHPIDTTAKGAGIVATLPGTMGAVAAGGAINTVKSVLTPEGREALEQMGDKILTVFTPEMQEAIKARSPEMIQHLVDTANSIGEQKKKEYISGPDEAWGAALGRTLHDDPMTVVMDATTGLAGGAGLARLAAKAAPLSATGAGAAAAAKVLDTAATYTNPLNIPLAGAKALANTTAAGRVADAVLPSVISRRILPSVADAAQNNFLDRATEGKVKDTRNALRTSAKGTGTTPGEIVPSSKPTTGQVVSQMDDAPTSFAAVQQDAADKLGSLSNKREVAQNKARLNHLQPIGRDPWENRAAFGSPLTDPADMEAARKASASTNYGRTEATRIKADQGLLDILNDPISQRAERNATTTSSIPGDPFWIGTNKPAVPASTTHTTVKGIPVTTFNPAQPAEFAELTGENFQRLKEEYDALIYGKGDAAEPNLTPSQRTELMKKREKLVQWGNTNLPGWEHARKKYAVQSNVLDRANLGDELTQTLGNALAGPDSAKLNATAYSNALKESPNKVNSTVSKATGNPRGTRIDDFLNPAEMGRTKAVMDDLMRAKLTDEQAVAGKDFRGQLNTAGTNFLGGDSLSSIPGMKPIVNFLMKGANAKVADRISNAMFDPAEMERILSQRLKREFELKAYKAGAGAAYKKTLGAVNKVPSIYPAMQDDKQKKKNALNR